MDELSKKELVDLVKSVFPKFPEDKGLGILVDIPNKSSEDRKSWEKRRKMAEDWSKKLSSEVEKLGLESVELIAYKNVGSNNADLPEQGCIIKKSLPDVAEGIKNTGKMEKFNDIFKDFQIFLAPTEFSTTAPLKNAAKKFCIRAATMPGFSSKMIPALKIDYSEVSRRVKLLKKRLDDASSAEVVFEVDKKDKYEMNFDLRYRKAHESAGRFPEKATAGNLPSGETYIVPYEGEKDEDSETEGILPVQIGKEVVYFNIEKNRAIDVSGEGDAEKAEKKHLKKEPAYGNMCELGFGVLADFGLKPIGEILLDEKLGFHVAFGRSDHFGGIVGPEDFSSPDAVIHLDRIYIKATQPRVIVKSLKLNYDKGEEQIIQNNNYLIF